MIEEPTVFILGAGAHCSYGYPSGEALKSECATHVRRSLEKSEATSFEQMVIHGVATQEQVATDRCNAFAEGLQEAGQASIDAFLNANRHEVGFEVIGKGAIAQVLLGYENKSTEGTGDDDWLSYLFKVMFDGVNSREQFVEKNKIGFITFNYDRLLEKKLHRVIKHSFTLDDATALESLQKIPIHHVYGTLGPFPYVPDSDPTGWINASKSIRTIFDAEHDQATLSAAKSLLSGASILCLLGFGFHRENIELLDLVKYINSPFERQVFSSRYQVTDPEWDRLTRPFSSAEIMKSDEYKRCLETIKRLAIF